MTMKCARAVLSVLPGLMAVSVFAGSVNLVRNPGLEEIGPDGVPVGWSKPGSTFRYEAGAGRNGSRGCVIATEDPKAYSFAKQTVPLKSGHRYRITGWIRTENARKVDKSFIDLEGANIGLEWSGKGKWMGGVYTPIVRHTTHEWRHVVLETDFLPKDADRFSVGLIMGRGTCGKAWFDDIAIEEIEDPAIACFISDAYRDTAVSGKVSFVARVRLPDAEIAERGVTARFRLPSEKAWDARDVGPDSFSNGVACLAVDVGTFPVGKSVVEFTLYAKDAQAKDGRVAIDARGIVFNRPKEDPSRRVTLDRHNRLIVGGRPFFPIGMYWNVVNQKDLDYYRQGPFNCLMSYASPTEEQMNLCAANGMKVLYNLKDAYLGMQWLPPHNVRTAADEIAWVADRVRRHKDHPALLGWYVNDEYGRAMRQRLDDRQKLIEDLDPDHPTWAVICDPDLAGEFADSYDVVGVDPYPVQGNDKRPISSCLDYHRRAADAMLGARPMWDVPQAFDWTWFTPHRGPSRLPTFAEMRNMTWQSVAAGANGILFYSFASILKHLQGERRDAFWKSVCSVAGEVAACTNVLLSTGKAPTVTGAPDLLPVRLARHDGTTYVFLANATREPMKARLRISEPFAALAKMPFSDDSVSLSAPDELTVDMAPLACAVVKLLPGGQGD